MILFGVVDAAVEEELAVEEERSEEVVSNSFPQSIGWRSNIDHSLDRWLAPSSLMNSI